MERGGLEEIGQGLRKGEWRGDPYSPEALLTGKCSQVDGAVGLGTPGSW